LKWCWHGTNSATSTCQKKIIHHFLSNCTTRVQKLAALWKPKIFPDDLQSSSLIQNLTIIKQKLEMLDRILHAGVCHNFLSISIRKLDKQIIKTPKINCGLFNNTSNIITQFPLNQFRLNAFSLKKSISHVLVINLKMQATLQKIHVLDNEPQFL